jgi:hypothetical protein
MTKQGRSARAPSGGQLLSSRSAEASIPRMRLRNSAWRSAITVLLGLAAFGGSAHAQTADADFAARCAAPGVVSCFGFDNTTTDVVRGINVYPTGNGVYRADLDTSTKASGGGSLRFDLPPPPNQGANISGSWSPAGGWGAKFSENSTFYVQYRMRLSPYLVQNGNFGNAIWKTSIFHYNSQTCASISLVTSDYYGKPLAQLDTDCGARWMWTTLDGTTATMNPPLLMQQTADLECAYGSDYASKCVNYTANNWMTLYYKVQVGTWDQPNSSVDAWLGQEGGPLKQFVKVRNFKLACNATDCTQSPAKDAGYNNVTLTPYMTELAPNDGPSSTAYMWFDEFIVSTQPIAAPNSGPRPNAPTALTAN